MGRGYKVNISSSVCNLTFEVQGHTTGQQLYTRVCQAVGIRESWFFGLYYEDDRGYGCWLEDKARLAKEPIQRDPEGTYLLELRVKFYPENAEEELVEEVSICALYNHVKSEVLEGGIYCHAETAILLGSYLLQAELGSYDPARHPKGFLSQVKYLPVSVQEKYQLSDEQWEERMVGWYGEHRGMQRVEAMLSYLKIAQDLDQYGITYYPIINRKGTQLWIGVAEAGLNIYEDNNHLTPRVAWHWPEIKEIAFSGSKFTIRLLDKKSVIQFNLLHARMVKGMLALCRGNHRRSIQKTQPSVEEAQVKEQAARARVKRRQEREYYESERKEYEAQRERVLLESERELEDLRRRLRMAEEEVHAERERRMAAESEVEALKSSLMGLQAKAYAAEIQAKALQEHSTKMQNELAAIEAEKLQLAARVAEAETMVSVTNEERESLLRELHMKEQKAQEYSIHLSMLVEEQHHRQDELQRINEAATTERSRLRRASEISDIQIRQSAKNGLVLPQTTAHSKEIQHEAVQETNQYPAVAVAAEPSSPTNQCAPLAIKPTNEEAHTLPPSTNQKPKPASTMVVCHAPIWANGNEGLRRPNGMGSPTTPHTASSVSSPGESDEEEKSAGVVLTDEQASAMVDAATHRLRERESSAHTNDEKLSNLRSEMKRIEIAGKTTEEDRIFDENAHAQTSKFQALINVKSSSLRDRILYFENL